MSQNGNNDDIIEKKDLLNQKLGSTRYIDLEFSHKSVGGETFINFSSLNTPPEYSALDGFTNPSPASLIEAQIRYNKANVELSSTGERGKLFHREDYIITSNGGIKLLYETVENEIISGVIRSVVRNQPAIIDSSKIVKTGTLAEGATTFVIGDSFKFFDNPNEQLGAVVIMRFKEEETPKMMFRNEGNLPLGIGNFYEVDGGNNLCNTVEFNEAGREGGENIVVYSYALQVGKPSASYLAELETLGGQVDTISNFLTGIHELGSNIFQTVANRIDLASFGQKVIQNTLNIANNVTRITALEQNEYHHVDNLSVTYDQPVTISNIKATFSKVDGQWWMEFNGGINLVNYTGAQITMTVGGITIASSPISYWLFNFNAIGNSHIDSGNKAGHAISGSNNLSLFNSVAVNWATPDGRWVFEGRIPLASKPDFI